MKQYPSIGTIPDPNLEYTVFDKLDGSNIRAEWNPKKGFYKFGSRKVLLSETDPKFGKAIALIKSQEEQIAHGLNSLTKLGAVCYFEFVGTKSFAGFHEDEDDHRSVLIDVDLERQGQMDPEDFLKAFLHVEWLPRVLHRGKVTQDFLEAVRAGTLPRMTFEGVVGKSRKPGKWAPPHMFKTKNRAWIQAVIAKHGEAAKMLL